MSKKEIKEERKKRRKKEIQVHGKIGGVITAHIDTVIHIYFYRTKLK